MQPIDPNQSPSRPSLPPPPPASVPAPPVFAGPPPVPSAGLQPPAPSRPRRSLWIAVAALAAVVVIVVVAVVLAGGSDDDEGDASTDGSAAPTLPGSSGTVDWELDVPTGWTEVDAPGFSEEAAWAVGTASSVFAANVNVITESPTVDVSLEEYLELSERNAPNLLPGVEFVSNEVVDCVAGPCGRIEYRGEAQGLSLQFLAYVIEVDGSFVVATFTDTADRFPTSVADVEPVLRTLRPG